MKISPRELREAQIPSKAFGFNQDVVDALLERAADTIEGLIEENRQLFETIERMRSEGTATSSEQADPFADVKMSEPEPVVSEPEVQQVAPAAQIDENLMMAQINEKEELINKTLLLAQKTADETLKTAKSQAEELVSEAEIKAKDLVDKAQANAEGLTGEAQEKANAELNAAQEQAQNLIAAAQAQADELVSAAQTQADSVHAQERDKFVALVQELTQEREQLVNDIQLLQGFDSQHRTKLKEIVETDLAQLVERKPYDLGKLPDLPNIDELKKQQAAQAKVADKEPEVVAHSEMAAPEVAPAASFDEMMDPEQEEQDNGPVQEILEPDSIEVDAEFEAEIVETVLPAGDTEAKYDTNDPFAAFVDTTDESISEYDSVVEAQIVEPAGAELDSSSSSSAFNPGVKTSNNEEMDDDDFFATLREAVQDDSPLGPVDEGDDKGGGKHKGLFKK